MSLTSILSVEPLLFINNASFHFFVESGVFSKNSLLNFSFKYMCFIGSPILLFFLKLINDLETLVLTLYENQLNESW